MLGVALGVSRVNEALEFLDGGAAGADVVEVRLDHFKEPFAFTTLVRRSPCPLIATNRPTREGGRSELAEPDRIRSLLFAAEAGAALVDVEWDAATPDLITNLQTTGAKVIVSRHAFDRIPSELPTWAADMASTNAVVVKVVGMARDAMETKVTLDVLATSARPTICIAMGQAGIASRILALRYDSCFLTFAAPPSARGTAPGQISINELLRVYRANVIGRRTAVYGVIGSTIDTDQMIGLNDPLHDRRPDAVVVPFVNRPTVESVIRTYSSLPIDGWYLPSAIPADRLEQVVRLFGSRAQRTGHVNVIVRREDELIAEDIAEGVERVIEFWLGGQPAVTSASNQTNTCRD
jgi:3-dehydroquinate dehydratase type I